MKQKKDLKITEGEWQTIVGGFSTKTKDSNLIVVFASNNDLEIVCHVRKDRLLIHSNQSFEDNATLIADAGTTYNKCHLTPSELLERLEKAEAVINSLSDYVRRECTVCHNLSKQEIDFILQDAIEYFTHFKQQ